MQTYASPWLQIINKPVSCSQQAAVICGGILNKCHPRWGIMHLPFKTIGAGHVFQSCRRSPLLSQNSLIEYLNITSLNQTTTLTFPVWYRCNFFYMTQFWHMIGRHFICSHSLHLHILHSSHILLLVFFLGYLHFI